jgi:hypothetical protein
MAPYFGLRGHKLHIAVWAEAFISVSIFGYNQAAAGGLLTTPAFARQFPTIDTLDTTGAQQQHNSTIQGN